MITLKINTLIKKIAQKKLSHKDEVTYYITHLLLITIQTQYFLFMGTDNGIVFWSEFILIIFSTITGCYLCWKISKKDIFITSMVCISVISTIYTFTFNILLGLSLYLSFPYILKYSDISKATIIYEVIGHSIFILLIICYWSINYCSLKIISKNYLSKEKIIEKQ